MSIQIMNTFVNALLADATYVNLVKGGIEGQTPSKA